MWSSTMCSRTADSSTRLNVRFMSPGASTMVPSTECAAGKASTSPPGQWAMLPGPAVTPVEPAVKAPARCTVRSVPAAEVTRIVEAARSQSWPRPTRRGRSSSHRSRSNTSGCSFEIISTRAPPPRMRPSSGACSRPSTVQSITNSLAASAPTTTGCSAMACDAPVERMGTGWADGGVGTIRSITRPPSDWAARRAVSTSTGRLWLSLNTVTVSPARSPQRRNC